MKQIYLLTDYKGFFGSKHNAVPYRSGMNKDLLKKYLKEYGFEVVFMNFSEVNFEDNWKDKIVLYTSQEDHNYHYKSYIEDIVYGLELAGANVIPEYKYLRANNNKVFMEILRDQTNLDSIKNIKAHHFGTIEELKNNIEKVNPQSVIKLAGGAMSSGVSLSKDKKDLIKKCKKISRTKYLYNELWDLGRAVKHKGYKRESKYRQRFIVQDFIPGLINDWKIVIYNEKYYILYRGVRDNDFRASGSGKFIFDEKIPDGILDFAQEIFNHFDVPNLSIDIAFEGNRFYLLEFQAVYFGTTTIEKSPFYFIKFNDKWKIFREKSELEKVYVDSIVKFINKKFGGSN